MIQNKAGSMRDESVTNKISPKVNRSMSSVERRMKNTIVSNFDFTVERRVCKESSMKNESALISPLVRILALDKKLPERGTHLSTLPLGSSMSSFYKDAKSTKGRDAVVGVVKPMLKQNTPVEKVVATTSQQLAKQMSMGNKPSKLKSKLKVGKKTETFRKNTGNFWFNWTFERITFGILLTYLLHCIRELKSIQKEEQLWWKWLVEKILENWSPKLFVLGVMYITLRAIDLISRKLELYYNNCHHERHTEAQMKMKEMKLKTKTEIWKTVTEGVTKVFSTVVHVLLPTEMVGEIFSTVLNIIQNKRNAPEAEDAKAINKSKKLKSDANVKERESNKCKPTFHYHNYDAHSQENHHVPHHRKSQAPKGSLSVSPAGRS